MKKTTQLAFLLLIPLFVGCSQKSAHGLPQKVEVQKLIANACLASRPGFQQYVGTANITDAIPETPPDQFTAVVNITNTVPDKPDKGKFTVNADVAFVYYGTIVSLGYIDYFILSRDESNTWKVEIVEKKK